MGRKTIRVIEYTCERCDYKWISKPNQDRHYYTYGYESSEPTHCPKCKTYYWDKPREKDMGWFYWRRFKRTGQPLPAYYANDKKFIEDSEKL